MGNIFFKPKKFPYCAENLQPTGWPKSYKKINLIAGIPRDQATLKLWGNTKLTYRDFYFPQIPIQPYNQYQFKFFWFQIKIEKLTYFTDKTLFINCYTTKDDAFIINRQSLQSYWKNAPRPITSYFRLVMNDKKDVTFTRFSQTEIKPKWKYFRTQNNVRNPEYNYYEHSNATDYGKKNWPSWPHDAEPFTGQNDISKKQIESLHDDMYHAAEKTILAYAKKNKKPFIEFEKSIKTRLKKLFVRKNFNYDSDFALQNRLNKIIQKVHQSDRFYHKNFKPSEVVSESDDHLLYTWEKANRPAGLNTFMTMDEKTGQKYLNAMIILYDDAKCFKK